MAQAQLNLTNDLRNTILNIPRFSTGCRRPIEILTKNPTIAKAIRASKTLQKLYNRLDVLSYQRLFNDMNKYFDSHTPFQLDDVLISGSVNEGTNRMNFNEFNTSDLDLMCVLKNIQVSEADQKRGNLTTSPNEDSPFVDLYLSDNELIKTWADFVEISSDREDERYLLSSMKLKLKLKGNYERIGHFSPYGSEEAEKVDDGPAIPLLTKLISDKVQVNFAGINMTGAEESCDFVLAIKCEGWPLCAQEWLSRSRCWPTQDIVKKIAKDNFHIVCKSSTEGNFRLSFSNAELLLIENLSALQHKVYRAFKAFVNHYKQKWSPNIKKIFCSYHLKTIVLWYCEETHPTDWNEDSVVGHLLALVDKLITALKERNLPMYFMPKYNLLQSALDGKSVADEIEKLRWNSFKITESIRLEEPTNIFESNLANSPVIREIKRNMQVVCDREVWKSNDIAEFWQGVLDVATKECNQFWKNIVGSHPIPSDKSFLSEMSKIISGESSVFQEFCEELNPMLSILKQCKETLPLLQSDSIVEQKKGLEMVKSFVNDESIFRNGKPIASFDKDDETMLVQLRQQLIQEIPKFEAQIEKLESNDYKNDTDMLLD